MSTAILISGQLRTFARCWPTQKWHVLRHFSKTLSGAEVADPHFFITVQAQPEWSEILAPLIAEFPGRVHVELKGDPDLSAHLTPELTRAYHQAPYTNTAPAHQLLLQHWYQNECWKHFLKVEPTLPQTNASQFRFFNIIRMRADLWFHSFEIPERLAGMSSKNWSIVGDNEAFTPWWGRFGGINDRVAWLGRKAAPYYFNVFEAIPELLAAGCPFHPESLVKANLERGNVSLHETLRAEFSTLRTTGEQRWPEITSVDIAHAALRAA
jgi:hypothetical protein